MVHPTALESERALVGEVKRFEVTASDASFELHPVAYRAGRRAFFANSYLWLVSMAGAFDLLSISSLALSPMLTTPPNVDEAACAVVPVAEGDNAIA